MAIYFIVLCCSFATMNTKNFSLSLQVMYLFNYGDFLKIIYRNTCIDFVFIKQYHSGKETCACQNDINAFSNEIRLFYESIPYLTSKCDIVFTLYFLQT